MIDARTEPVPTGPRSRANWPSTSSATPSTRRARSRPIRQCRPLLTDADRQQGRRVEQRLLAVRKPSGSTTGSIVGIQRCGNRRGIQAIAMKCGSARNTIAKSVRPRWQCHPVPPTSRSPRSSRQRLRASRGLRALHRRVDEQIQGQGCSEATRPSWSRTRARQDQQREDQTVMAACRSHAMIRSGRNRVRRMSASVSRSYLVEHRHHRDQGSPEYGLQLNLTAAGLRCRGNSRGAVSTTRKLSVLRQQCSR